jgi:hypothetical protein
MPVLSWQGSVSAGWSKLGVENGILLVRRQFAEKAKYHPMFRQHGNCAGRSASVKLEETSSP